MASQSPRSRSGLTPYGTLFNLFSQTYRSHDTGPDRPQSMRVHWDAFCDDSLAGLEGPRASDWHRMSNKLRAHRIRSLYVAAPAHMALFRGSAWCCQASSLSKSSTSSSSSSQN